MTAPVENNVVPLRPRAQKDAFADMPLRTVWECSCGCHRFSLHKGGGIECDECGTWQNGRWVDDLYGEPA